MDGQDAILEEIAGAESAMDETESALSALTDGQHIFYVTADQTQLVISTFDSQQADMGADQYSSMIESGVAMVNVTDGEQNVEEELQANEVGQAESVLAIVGEDSDQVRQAIEITTEDGRRVTLLIPSTGEDPCELATEF